MGRMVMFAIFRKKREDAHVIAHPLKRLTSNNQAQQLKSADIHKQKRFLIDYALMSSWWSLSLAIKGSPGSHWLLFIFPDPLF